MARKRLSPIASPTTAAPEPLAPVGAPEVKAFGVAPRRAGPPIARVAGETAAEAALATLSAEVAQARAEGRLIVSLPLEAVAEDHMVRDRLDVDEGEMAVLMHSLTERGQQTAIEVIDLGVAEGPRYGLISGWRRLMALRRLQAATGEARFATVKALVRAPETAAEAYRAMVDENEIRVGLSHWERARIAVRAAELGLYPTVQQALRDLFSSASRAKRSKIGSFVGLYQALGDSLRFPTALPERLGLALARAVEEEPGFAAALAARMAAATPEDAAAEQAILTGLLEGPGAPETGGADAGGADSSAQAADPAPAAAPALPETRPLPPRSGAERRLEPGPEPEPGEAAVRQQTAASAPPEPAPAGDGVSHGTSARAPETGAGRPAVRLVRQAPDRLVLEGPGADAGFEAALAAWLAGR